MKIIDRLLPYAIITWFFTAFFAVSIVLIDFIPKTVGRGDILFLPQPLIMTIVFLMFQFSFFFLLFAFIIKYDKYEKCQKK